MTVNLKAASKLEIISLIDNTVDYLSSAPRKEVQPLWHWTTRRSGEMPMAEHGFSMLIKIRSADSKSYTVLFDTGVSAEGVAENARRMGLDLGEVQTVVLSHGHFDHFGGLTEAVNAINRENLQIIVHEDMFKQRGTKNSRGEIRLCATFPEIPQPKEIKIICTNQPHLIADGYACITGEIPRTVEFEKGLMHNQVMRDGAWQPDPNITDERALIANVEGKGLVVVSGCAHAGIINTVRYAQEVTGESKVYAIFGGFHLAGKAFEKRIETTITELKRFVPELVAASHCTGWRALYALAGAFPESFVFNSVGNRYVLTGQRITP